MRLRRLRSPPLVSRSPCQHEAQVLSIVTQLVDGTQGIPQAERETAQSPRTLLDPTMRALDRHMRDRLGRIQRDLGQACARPAGAPTVEPTHAAIPVQVEDIVTRAVREAEGLACLLRGRACNGPRPHGRCLTVRFLPGDLAGGRVVGSLVPRATLREGQALGEVVKPLGSLLEPLYRLARQILLLNVGRFGAVLLAGRSGHFPA